MDDRSREDLLALIRERDLEIERLQMVILDLTARLNETAPSSPAAKASPPGSGAAAASIAAAPASGSSSLSALFASAPSASGSSTASTFTTSAPASAAASRAVASSSIPRFTGRKEVPRFRRSSSVASADNTPQPSPSARFARQSSIVKSDPRGRGAMRRVSSPVRRRRSSEPAAVEEPEALCSVVADAGFATRLSVKGRTMTVFAPRDFVPSETDTAMPEEQLRMQRVLGYRTKGVRDNLHCLSSNETLYSVGRICIVQTGDGSQRLYAEHTGDVQCMASHFSSPVVASGQKSWMTLPSDQAHVRVWNYEDLSTVRILGLGIIQHSVACLAFSPSDESLLASVDESVHHTVVLWSWRAGNPLAQVTGHSETICTIGFNPITHALVTCGKGHVNLWNIAALPDNPSRFTLAKKPGLFQTHPKPKFVSCLCFAPNGDTLTGDSNGNISVWAAPLPVFNISTAIREAHKGGVTALQATPHGFLSAGSSDQCVRIWAWNYQPFQVLEGELNLIDIGHPIKTLSVALTDEGPSLSEFVVGCTDNSIFSVDASDGSVAPVVRGPQAPVEGLARLPGLMVAATPGAVTAWLLGSFQFGWEWHVSRVGDGAQIVCVDACTTSGLVCVGLHNGVALLSNVGFLLGYFEESRGVIAVKLSPSGKLLAIGLADGSVVVKRCLTELEELPIVCVCKGLQARLASLDWSHDETALLSTSVSYELVSFNATTGEPIPAADARSLTWATYSSKIGWASCGVMGLNVSASCVERSPDERVLVVGDDLGDLRLLKWPSHKITALSRTHRGHGSSVTAVRCLDDDMVASVSAQDNMLCVWQLRGSERFERNESLGEGSLFDDAQSVDIQSLDMGTF